MKGGSRGWESVSKGIFLYDDAHPPKEVKVKGKLGGKTLNVMHSSREQENKVGALNGTKFLSRMRL